MGRSLLEQRPASSQRCRPQCARLPQNRRLASEQTISGVLLYRSMGLVMGLLRVLVCIVGVGPPIAFRWHSHLFAACSLRTARTRFLVCSAVADAARHARVRAAALVCAFSGCRRRLGSHLGVGTGCGPFSVWCWCGRWIMGPHPCTPWEVARGTAYAFCGPMRSGCAPTNQPSIRINAFPLNPRFGTVVSCQLPLRIDQTGSYAP